MLKFTRKLYVPLTWTILTQVLLSLPGSLLEGSGLIRIPHLDKIAHLGLFGGLSLFWSLFLHHRNYTVRQRTGWLMLFIISVYGVAVEFFQFYVIPNRSFDVWDIVADICGALCGYFATIVIIKNSH